MSRLHCSILAGLLLGGCVAADDDGRALSGASAKSDEAAAETPPAEVAARAAEVPQKPDTVAEPPTQPPVPPETDRSPEPVVSSDRAGAVQMDPPTDDGAATETDTETDEATSVVVNILFQGAQEPVYLAFQTDGGLVPEDPAATQKGVVFAANRATVRSDNAPEGGKLVFVSKDRARIYHPSLVRVGDNRRIEDDAYRFDLLKPSNPLQPFAVSAGQDYYFELFIPPTPANAAPKRSSGNFFLAPPPESASSSDTNVYCKDGVCRVGVGASLFQGPRSELLIPVDHLAPLIEQRQDPVEEDPPASADEDPVEEDPPAPVDDDPVQEAPPVPAGEADRR